MAGQPGFFDLDQRYALLSAAGDPLERLAVVVSRSCASLVWPSRHRVPDAKTIWLFPRAGAIERLFARFDRVLREAGYLAMGGQIVDATVIQARRRRLTRSEKATIKGGGVPSCWSKAKRAQMDTEGRWTLKRGRKRSAEPSAPHARTRSELVIPVFGYKNHLGIDRRYGFIRRFAMTDAASHDSRQLGKLLDPDNTASGVWADAAYRSAANAALLARRGLVPHLQRPKPRGRPIPPHIVRGNASRARVRVAIEHVFAAQKCRLSLVICPRHGQARARQPGHQHDPPRLVRDPCGPRPELAGASSAQRDRRELISKHSRTQNRPSRRSRTRITGSKPVRRGVHAVWDVTGSPGAR
jgi:IS5 family transposase